MESKTQGSRSRPRTQNNPRPKTDPLEAKDRNTRGQGPRTQRVDTSIFKKKGLLKFTARSLARSPRRRKKKGHVLGPFFTNQKIVLSSTANTAFSRTCWLGGQGLHVFSRTSSRTPSLKNSNAIQENYYFFCPSHRKIFIIFA